MTGKKVAARAGIFSVLIAGGLAAQAAFAQQSNTAPQEPREDSGGYITILPFYFSADDDWLTTGDGHGMAVGYGHQWHGGWYWEMQTFGNRIMTNPNAATDDYQLGAGLDLRYRFGKGNGFAPFVLFGAGAVRNDVLGDSSDDTDWFGNAGVGFISGGLGKSEIRIRGEARYVRNNFETPFKEGMNDWRIGLGVQVPLGRRVVEHEVVHEKVVTKTVPADIADADGDGVPDQLDKCPGTLAGLATDNRGCAAKKPQEVRLQGVTFELNSAQLTPSASATLQRVAAALKGEPSLRAEIAGYTDNTGDADYNLKLSQQRADSVRQFLIAQGIGADRLEARGYGEAQPVADNSTSAGRERNRRVEFRVLN